MATPANRLAVQVAEGETFEPAKVGIERLARSVDTGRSGADGLPRRTFSESHRDALERFGRGEGMRPSIHGRRATSC